MAKQLLKMRKSLVKKEFVGYCKIVNKPTHLCVRGELKEIPMRSQKKSPGSLVAKSLPENLAVVRDSDLVAGFSDRF